MTDNTTTLRVDGMSCEHCVSAVTKAVGALPGVAAVTVNLTEKTAAVRHDLALCSVEDIKAAIEAQGYDIIA